MGFIAILTAIPINKTIPINKLFQLIKY